MEKIKTVIFDIDGTLADVSHRVHLIPDWDAFQQNHHLDKPIDAVIEIYHAFKKQDYDILFVTCRLEKERQATIDWMVKHITGLNEYILDHTLIMRPDNDYISDVLLKEKVLKQLEDDGREILFVVEDRKRVLDMWRENGVFTLDVSQGKGDF